MSAVSLVVQGLNDHQPIIDEQMEAFGDVPGTRPKKFVSVERTGGPQGGITNLPMFAIQVWAESSYEAVRLAELVANELKPALISHPGVARVRVMSVHNFPGPNREPRAQVVAELVTTT